MGIWDGVQKSVRKALGDNPANTTLTADEAQEIVNKSHPPPQDPDNKAIGDGITRGMDRGGAKGFTKGFNSGS